MEADGEGGQTSTPAVAPSPVLEYSLGNSG